MFLDLAEAHGFRDEVEALLEGRQGPPPEDLSLMLRKHRAKTGITRTETHQRSNISRSRLSQIECGHTRHIGLRTLQAIAYGYRLPFIRVLLAALNSKT